MLKQTRAASLTVFSTGRDIASITHLEVKCLLFFQGSETNVPTYFLSVLNTGLMSAQCWAKVYGAGLTGIAPLLYGTALAHNLPDCRNVRNPGGPRWRVAVNISFFGSFLFVIASPGSRQLGLPLIDIPESDL